MVHCADPMSFRLFAAAVACATLLGSAVSAQDGDVRAQWVQASSLQSADSIRRMVTTAVTNGINTLFVPAGAAGHAFDPLAETIAAAHDRGVRVHAWINVNLAASATELPASRDHLIYQHPEWLMVPRELAPELRSIDVRSPEYLGRLARWTRANVSRLQGLYVSPLHTGAHLQIAAALKDIVTRYAVDGVHLDYIGFPRADFDYSRAAIEAFRADVRGRMPVAERARIDAVEGIDPFAYPEELPEEWRLFRQTQVTALVTRLRSTAKAVRANVVVSAAVIPDPALAAREAFQDWRTWLDNGFIDALCPVWESGPQGRSAALIADVRALAGSKPVWIRN
jgi:uncharacterized lipoprotein YddW (UPF0748 family)